MATVGDDYAALRRAPDELRLAQRTCASVAGTFTAQAFITTDLDDNQITAFHPGRDELTRTRTSVTDAARRRRSASSRPTAATACCSTRASSTRRAFRSSSIPGRACRCSTARSCWNSSSMADYVTVNDYEGAAAAGAHRQDARGARETREGAVVTRGRAGFARSIAGGRQLEIPCVKPRAPWSTRPAAATLIAPACSTASRSGWTGRPPAGWLRCSARIKIASRGGQNHRFDRAEIEARYKEAFRASPW